jgi:hypothetical protein
MSMEAPFHQLRDDCLEMCFITPTIASEIECSHLKLSSLSLHYVTLYLYDKFGQGGQNWWEKSVDSL